jgi:Arc/MetJ-type ribon-helix-helix transcriptional regulator
MSNRTITLSEPLARVVATQVKSGRFKDTSAAVQEAVWSFFVGANSPFKEYGVTP